MMGTSTCGSPSEQACRLARYTEIIAVMQSAYKSSFGIEIA